MVSHGKILSIAEILQQGQSLKETAVRTWGKWVAILFLKEKLNNNNWLDPNTKYSFARITWIISSFSRIQSINLETCQVYIKDVDQVLLVDVQFIDPFIAAVNCYWFFFGEICTSCNSQLYLRARTGACIDDLDFSCFKKALAVQRSYLLQKYHDS